MKLEEMQNSGSEIFVQLQHCSVYIKNDIDFKKTKKITCSNLVEIFHQNKRNKSVVASVKGQIWLIGLSTKSYQLARHERTQKDKIIARNCALERFRINVQLMTWQKKKISIKYRQRYWFWNAYMWRFPKKCLAGQNWNIKKWLLLWQTFERA